MSQLMFWNKQNNNNNTKNQSNDNSKNNTNGATEEAKKDKRNWLHTPDALVNGHVVYLVKFFGNLPVEQAKGIEVVKDAIRKLQFAQEMKKAETGTQEKCKKVEITISVDGVAVQEPRTQKILHQFPLHNISYCADEKGVKKFFSFIAKTVKPIDGGVMNGSTAMTGSNGVSSSIGNNSTGGSNTEETHECFVFISNKLASDITLTIGQAFDLAYKKYINSVEKTDLGKAQQQNVELEKALAIYKSRLRELSLKLPKSELDAMLFKMGIKDILDLPAPENGALTNGNGNKANMLEDKLLIDTNSTHSMKSSSGSSSSFVPIVPPRNNTQNQIIHKSNSQKMEELLLNSDSDSDFDPRADECVDGGSSSSGGGGKNISNDLFGFEPSKSYGQQLFTNQNNNIINNNNDSKSMNNNHNGINLNLNSVSVNNSNNNTSNGFSNDLTPPLLAPPPKVAAPRRSTSVTNNITSNNNNNVAVTNGNTDLFGSDPFEINNGPSIFKSKMMSVDDFTLESLDPLRK
ncbi:PTB domain-containing adapter protein ced-6 [Ceratitis capitata]|uniref:PTB domain-containing adapter protein ced-6 n=2 Tax=Ceratitis capitata TaxID=7213 RepID=W8C471_CERCA|nr:PTB domain-containing adapter protein ced-6 [Ceratitis capitata]XP_004520647.1 PTB domain-containing adapter protein ced-6 [Ceratitis capitata]XP_004520648.1 PTB domain-containing adapter protein ced-6 [Ceratitis capitata]XP_004520650.1 PTB domain-containing adapter protein ced-6 [Ceratitis capitata]XP_004520651.1 PTB domain-containing adapter protein ced-6 [Ceratitis capitata]XP_020712693.1 PTB domain-containing adapter protein ced-6 [Ceratitis capitata]XP_020712694.1 PTB domain-containin